MKNNNYTIIIKTCLLENFIRKIYNLNSKYLLNLIIYKIYYNYLLNI